MPRQKRRRNPSGRRNKGEGRAAEILSKRLGVGLVTIYQARKLLKHGSDALIEQVRTGGLSIKKASAMLNQKAVHDA
ncbi:MAG: hypothetical protein LBP76_07650 [Treponema sp.]|jgi:transposase|nr:hypothetical protein [Treponema sp.]